MGLLLEMLHGLDGARGSLFSELHDINIRREWVVAEATLRRAMQFSSREKVVVVKER